MEIDDDKKLKEEVLKIYTPLSVAKEEIQKRWNDKELRKKVEIYLRDIPESFKTNPRAVLFRNIATPDFEFQRAVNLAQDLGLKPLYLEYLSDRFCTRSLDKLYLGKMSFFHCRDKNNNCIISKRTLFDLKKNDGKPFKNIVTCEGKNIIDFHHQLFMPLFPEVSVYDISSWIKNKGRNSIENYPYFLSLFLCHGVLLEAYNADSSEERKFIRNVIIPSFHCVLEIFGIKPIIVKLFNGKEERDLFWYCHPQFLMEKVNEITKNKK